MTVRITEGSLGNVEVEGCACSTCCLKRERDEALADNERLRALLREVEWLEGFDSDGDEVIECPLCHAQQSSYGKYRSHTSDCCLAAALKGQR